MNLNYRQLVFSLVTLTFWMPSYFYAQILPAYVKHLGGSLSMIGLVSGAYGLTQALFRIPTGVLADSIGRKKPFVVIGVLAGIVSNLLFIVAGSPLALFWARALAGVSAATWVALTVLIAAYFPQDKVTPTMGLLFAVSNVGQLIASFSGAFLAELWGWKAPFTAALITGIFGLFALMLMGNETKAPPRRFKWHNLLAVSLHRWVALASVLGILLQYGSWSVISFSPVFAVNLGASKGDLGILSLFGMVPTIFGSFLLGKLLQLIKRDYLLLFGFLCVAIGLLFLPITKNFWILALLTALGGLGRGIVLPALMGMCQKGIDDSLKTTAMGIFQAVYALGMFLGPTVSGIISDGFGEIFTFAMGSALMVGSGFLSFTITRRNN